MVWKRPIADIPSQTIIERLFSPCFGDLRLLIINRLVWLEFAAFILTGNQDQGFALLAFISFGLSTLMLMLMLKHQSGKATPNGN